MVDTKEKRKRKQNEEKGEKLVGKRKKRKPEKKGGALTIINP